MLLGWLVLLAGYAEDESTDDDEGTLDITELPTRALAARAKPMTQQLGAHLAHLSQSGCQQQVSRIDVLRPACMLQQLGAHLAHVLQP
jgi:hypothetical protein